MIMNRITPICFLSFKMHRELCIYSCSTVKHLNSRDHVTAGILNNARLVFSPLFSTMVKDSMMYCFCINTVYILFSVTIFRVIMNIV